METVEPTRTSESPGHPSPASIHHSFIRPSLTQTACQALLCTRPGGTTREGTCSRPAPRTLPPRKRLLHGLAGRACKVPVLPHAILGRRGRAAKGSERAAERLRGGENQGRPPAADRGPTRAGAAGAESPRGRGLLSAAHAEMADPDAPGRPCCWRALATRLDDGHLRVARSDGQAPGPVPSGSCKPSRRHSWDLASGPPAAPAAPLLGFPPCFPLVHLLHLLSNPSLPS